MGDDRGQTTLDFAIAASTFLLAAAFVFMFVPGMLQPYTGSSDGSLVADRAATQLGTNLLGGPDSPHVLDRDCTVEFFDADGNTGGCRFVADADDVDAALSIDDTTRINVTVEHLDVTNPGDPVVSLDGTRLAAGAERTDGSTSVTSAQRLVTIDDTTYRLYVRVW